VATDGISAAGTPFRIGFSCPPSRELAAALEAMPIDSLWVGGHVASPNQSPEGMVQLARLAALTDRVTVGTAILLLPLYPPAVVAKQAADLDRVTGGRVVLGIGVGGEYPAEFRACGVPIGERGRRTDEAIPLLRRLWTGEEISHPGPFHPMEEVRILPAPVQPGGPPIVVAGRQPVAMRRAATLGDGWMPYLYSARRFADSVRTVREEAEKAGRALRRPSSGWRTCSPASTTTATAPATPPRSSSAAPTARTSARWSIGSPSPGPSTR
jgi:probable F420-dependent oxidoreductase